jgi:hypothetical protein
MALLCYPSIAVIWVLMSVVMGLYAWVQGHFLYSGGAGRFSDYC